MLLHPPCVLQVLLLQQSGSVPHSAGMDLRLQCPESGWGVVGMVTALSGYHWCLETGVGVVVLVELVVGLD